MGKAEYLGRYVYQKINPVTGEVLETKEVDEFSKPVNTGRTGGFMIAYLAELINMIDKLGNKKMTVVKFILEHMDKRTNTLIMTTTELAKKSKVGFNTVIETLKILDDAGLIQRKTGAIMLSPRLMNNRDKKGEASMMITYRQWGAEKEEPQETPPTPEAPAPEPKKEGKAA